MLKGLFKDYGLVFCLEHNQHLGCHASRTKYPMHLLKLKNLKTFFINFRRCFQCRG